MIAYSLGAPDRSWEVRLSEQVVDCTDGFAVLGKRLRTRDAILISVSPHTYLPDGELAKGWFPNILGAFRHLAARLAQEGKSPHRFASIGVGPGLDAIAAVELLNVETLWLTDLHEDVVNLARSNVLENCLDLQPESVHGFVSDLCEGLIARGIKVDVLYENLPNLPASEISLGVGAMTASFFDNGRLAEIPATYSGHRLGLHYLVLNQARRVLTSQGSVVCCIGGRVKVHVIQSMFTHLGYTPEVLNFDIVRQFESDKVLAGYMEAEKENGVEFTFYPYDDAREVVGALLRGNADLDEVTQQLSGLAIGAAEARKLELAGRAIGHLGIIWRGVPRTQ